MLSKDQIASECLVLVGAHGVVGLSRPLRTSVNLRKVSGSIPDVPTTDDLLFSSLGELRSPFSSGHLYSEHGFVFR